MGLNRIIINGHGAVTPAGWGVPALQAALDRGETLPFTSIPRPNWQRSLHIRTVPERIPRPSSLSHPRLRRTSRISQFAVAAALEALGEGANETSHQHLGIVFCVMAGCVNYSRRFYDETLRDPVSASPIVFPETVFNAPASHLAAILGCSDMSYTLVGDPGTFLSGLALAAHALCAGQIDACLVIGAEESDWLVSDAYRRFERHAILSEGAGALYLRYGPPHPGAIQLNAITSAHSFANGQTRAQATKAMRAELDGVGRDYLLCDGMQGSSKGDAAERNAWTDWVGTRLSVKTILGEGLAAASAWQCVAAVENLRLGRCAGANVSVVGCNQQAIGAEFLRIPNHLEGEDPAP